MISEIKLVNYKPPVMVTGPLQDMIWTKHKDQTCSDVSKITHLAVSELLEKTGARIKYEAMLHEDDCVEESYTFGDDNISFEVQVLSTELGIVYVGDGRPSYVNTFEMEKRFGNFVSSETITDSSFGNVSVKDLNFMAGWLATRLPLRDGFSLFEHDGKNRTLQRIRFHPRNEHEHNTWKTSVIIDISKKK